MSAAAAPPLPGPEEPNVCVSGAEEPICAPQRKCKRVAAGAHSPALARNHRCLAYVRNRWTSTARPPVRCTTNPRLKRLLGAAWGDRCNPARTASIYRTSSELYSGGRSSQVCKVAAPFELRQCLVMASVQIAELQRDDG